MDGKQLFFISGIIELLVCAVFFASGAFVYVKTVKNRKNSLPWAILAGALGLIGLLFLLSFTFSMFLYFITPRIIDELL